MKRREQVGANPLHGVDMDRRTPANSNPRIGVFGATGLVGRELLSILIERSFEADTIRAFASERSAGTSVAAGGAHWPVERFVASEADSIDLAFLATGSALSRELVPCLLAAGATVIDCSSAYRGDPEVPLVIPEINGHLLASDPAPRLVASPNCSTTIALMAVEPIRRAAGIRRMTVCTYQAVSGAGAAALEGLDRELRDHADGELPKPAHFSSPCLFNVFSHESAVDEGGENQEELKIRAESRRIWNDADVAIAATCVRVPTRRAHAEAINLSLERPLSAAEAREILASADGLVLFDREPGTRAPEPRDAEGRDEVLVGRVRADHSQPEGLGLWIFAVGDQLRKGAALNAVQIAESLRTSLTAAQTARAAATAGSGA